MPDTIPLRKPNCPAWRRSTVRHATGLLSVIIPESCPLWAGARTRCSRGMRLLCSEAQYSRDFLKIIDDDIDPTRCCHAGEAGVAMGVQDKNPIIDDQTIELKPRVFINAIAA
jgi:hypothetical protein